MDYASLGNTPISEDNPTGSDCRYEDTFEILQAEIDKLSSPTAEGKVDWSKIVETSAGILKTQSKDLTVASYLAVGLVHNHKVEGLDQGIQILKDLVETYWDNLYPPKKRMRGREGAFTWWLEKTEETFQQIKPKPIPAELAERMQGNLAALDAQLVEKMPDPPLLRPVQRQIEAIPVEKAPAAKEEAAAEPVAAAPKAPAAAAVAPKPQADAEEPSSIESDKDALKSIDVALKRIRESSLFLLQRDLSNPLAYRYRRMASWSGLSALPPNSEGATQIPPPPPQMVSELTALQDEDNWPALIQNCEQKLSQFRFWFDLNHMVAQGLKKLGNDHHKALDEVCRETAYFLQRLPGLDNLAFADGMPFADPQTRKWLKTIGFGEGGVPTAAGAGTESGQDAHFDAKVQKALAMARKKRLTAAVSLLQDEMQQTPSHQYKMRWRLAIVQVLLAVKKSQLALPHIEQVLSDIDAFNLEAWDPPMALEGLTAVWKGFDAQTANEYKARGVELLNRIATRYPAEALRLSKQK